MDAAQAAVGDFVRAIHEQHGVVFHLEEMATAIDGGNVKLKGGTTLPADSSSLALGCGRASTWLSAPVSRSIAAGEVAACVPQTRGYRYVVANGRGLLVGTSRIVVGVFANANAR